MVIGVEGRDVTGADTDDGAVYIFTSSSGVWTQQAYLTTHNAGSTDAFGYSVAIDGDVLVAGARGKATTGVVYTFQ